MLVIKMLGNIHFLDYFGEGKIEYYDSKYSDRKEHEEPETKNLIEKICKAHLEAQIIEFGPGYVKYHDFNLLLDRCSTVR